VHFTVHYNVFVQPLNEVKRVFGPKRDDVQGRGENYIIRNLMICTAKKILLVILLSFSLQFDCKL
jgi:hypothetical protein